MGCCGHGIGEGVELGAVGDFLAVLVLDVDGVDGDALFGADALQYTRLWDLVFISAPFAFCFVDELLDACGLLIRKRGVFADKMRCQGFIKNGQSQPQAMKSLTTCGGVASCGYRDGQDRTSSCVSPSQPWAEFVQIGGGSRGKFGGISTQG